MTPERDQQIMNVFLAAVELPLDRHASFLDDACDADEELRTEVESLLKHHVPETLVDDGDHPTRRDEEIAPFLLPRQTSALLSVLSKTLPGKFVSAAIILAVGFASLWYLTHNTIQGKLRQNVESQLQTILNADVAAVQIWLAKQNQMADNWAEHRRVKKTLSELARLSDEQKLTTSELESTQHHAEFLEAIGPLLAQREIAFVGVFAPDGHGIAKCPDPRVDDVYWSSRGAASISPCFQGETIFMPTFHRGANVRGGDYQAFRAAAVSVVAPVRNDAGDVIAAMQLIMEIDHEFATLFSIARLGETGDSYAFDQRGVVLTDLRHQRGLSKMGLIPEGRGAALHLQLRDPGVDLRIDRQTRDELTTRPLCKVPAIAIANGESLDADGYRNYLGVPVVGAARWLPQYGFGVVTEFEYEEAYAPLQSLTWLFGGVFGLFVSAAMFAAIVSMKNVWLSKQVHEARKLGPYTLGELIGQGGMAKVYKASHAVLRRPTAVKLIQRSEAGEQMVARFEHEVQIASELTHPNTIQIYDYGHTDDGVFYFAMEYLPGISLAELVIRDGPLPPARVVYLLHQVCGSLAEAHGKGLIHRDIKPANIMLCERGGQYDFVKVLDFGLVKEMARGDLDVTRPHDLTGTPLYIAPERICRSPSIDARSDIYSVGTVAFYLLTGQHLFDGESSTDILYQVVNEQPRYPSEVGTHEIPAKLDELVISCLAKNPRERPADISEVMEILDFLAAELPWTQADARQAWRCGEESLEMTASLAAPESSHHSPSCGVE